MSNFPQAAFPFKEFDAPPLSLADLGSIESANRILLEGGLVAIPTETVYGLAGDATNPRAIACIFQTKQRPADHPLILHCGDAAAAFACCRSTSDLAQRLAEKFWPGPMTLILPRAEHISPEVTGGQATVAVRVPAHRMTLALLQRLGRPLAAPSANRFGRVSPTLAEHVTQEFGQDLWVLDGGPCQVGIESTIIDCCDPRGLTILRPGFISAEDIFAELGVSVQAQAISTSPRVSGSLPSHYAPNAQVVILPEEKLVPWFAQQVSEIKQLALDHTSSQQTISLYPRTLLCIPPSIESKYFGAPPSAPNLDRFITLKHVPEDPPALARQLYALLRQADDEHFARIVFCQTENTGIGNAISDRLRRAAADKSSTV